MNLQQEQANLLIECLPYIKHFFGETVVIKYGGHAMENEALKQAFAKNIALLRYVGIKPVIVHGGGPQIGSLLERLGIKSTFREGQRVTDDATMEAVEMVLVGQVNNEIVNLLNLAGVRAVGLSGKDAHSLRAEKLRLYAKAEQGGTTAQNAPTAPVSMNATQNGSPAPASPDSLGSVVKAMPQLVDLGKVGEVSSVDTSLIQALSGAGFIPVIAPVGVDEAGNTYNINADSVAGAVAGALKAKRLLLLTDVAGVLDADKKLIRSITVDKAAGLFEDGTLKGGMIPKIRCCLEALAAGVEKAMVIDGRVENCILLELFTDSGIGTEIVH